MNKNTFSNNILFIMILTFAMNFSAQSEPEKQTTIQLQVKDTANAIFLNKTSLILDKKNALVSYYKADITKLNFKNPLEGDIYFNKITDNLLSYKVDYSTNSVVIWLHLAYANPAWKISDWNNYIQSKLNPQY